MRTSFSKLFDEIGTVDQVGIEERVAKFTTRSIKKSSKLWGLKTAVSMVDLTTLEGKDTPGKVASLCQKAARRHCDQGRFGRDGVPVGTKPVTASPGRSENGCI
jgi:deoxyribose-phosphate aldolase